MAKPIVLSWNGVQSSFGLEKLDRSKLYGKRQRQVLDPEGRRCERAELTRDGALLVRSGMTAQAYFDDDGRWIPNRDLVGLDTEDQPVALAPSTLGVEQPLEGPVSADELLDLSTRSVYVLTPESLDPELRRQLLAGEIFRFPFNYRTDYNTETAFLVGNDSGFFALVGNPAPAAWCELQSVATETFEDDSDDELDFEMF
jgi:hypothetical protein